MTVLESDVRVGERAGRIPKDTVEATQNFFVLVLLLVDDAQGVRLWVRAIHVSH